MVSLHDAWRHELLHADYPRPLHFANWFMQRHERFIEDIVIGNEAAFHMNGRAAIMFASMNPDFHNDLRMSREKVSVWIGICGNGSIVGPIFYKNTLTGA